MSNVNVFFTPVEDFFSEEFQSQYVKGLSYQAKPEDGKLLALLPEWVEAGKVYLGSPKASSTDSKMSGEGNVTSH